MSDTYGSDFITISDEDGKTYELEHVHTVVLNDVFYMAFLPADMDEESEDFGLVILKQEEDENGELFLVVPDDDECDMAHQKIIEELFENEEDEDSQ